MYVLFCDGCETIATNDLVVNFVKTLLNTWPIQLYLFGIGYILPRQISILIQSTLAGH